MIKAGKLLEEITSHISKLKTEIELCGSIGLQNIHKHSENFMARLLNLVYGYQLHNLGVTPNFPGLDIGDETRGIGYQISSQKGSDKVDDTLRKCLKFQNYITFPTIRIFMLLGKQHKYSITVDTSSHFSFDEDHHIFDFKDLLQDIQHFDPSKLEDIYHFLNDELSDYIAIVKKKDPNSAPQQTTLIDVITSSEKLNLPYFSHFAFEIRLRGTRASVPEVHQKLSTYVKVGRRSEFIPIFNKNLSKGGSTQEYKFVYGPHKESNIAVEMILKLLPNAIRYEWAGYYSNHLLVTNFRREFDPIILLLFFCETLYIPKLMDIEVDIEINTNAELNFASQASYFKATGGMVSYQLNPKNLERSLVLRETGESNLVEIMKVIVQGFSAEPGQFSNADPFLTFDEDTQLAGLTALGDSVFSSKF